MRAIILFFFLIYYRCYSSGYQNQNSYLIGGIFHEREEPEGEEYKAFDQYIYFDPYSTSVKYTMFKEFVKDYRNSFFMANAINNLIKYNATVIFGQIHPSALETIVDLTDKYKIPFLTTSDVDYFYQDNKKRGKNIIRLRPMVSQGILDIIMDNKWNKVLYLYDALDALHRLRMVLRSFNEKYSSHTGLTVDVRKIEGPDTNKSAEKSDSIPSFDIKKILNYSIKTWNYSKYIVLDISDRNTRKSILDQVTELKLDRSDYHFFMVECDINQMYKTVHKFGGFNITAFSPINERMNYSTALLKDGLKLIDKAFKILINRGEQVNSFTILDALRSMKESFNGITGNVQFDDNFSRINYNITLVETRTKRSLHKAGTWSRENGTQLQEETIDRKVALKNDKNDTVRKVTTIDVPPYIFYDNRTGEFTGFCVDLLEEISKIFDFKYELHVVKDGNYGREVGKKKWDGMIGELLRGEAEVAVGPLTITSERERVVDFSTPFMEFGLSVLYLKPDRSIPPSIFLFLNPLSESVWICISFAYLGVSVVLFLISRFSLEEWQSHHIQSNWVRSNERNSSEFDQAINNSNQHQNKDLDDATIISEKTDSFRTGALARLSIPQNDFTIFNSFWFALSSFVQQGGDILPRSLHGRIVGGVWWFFTLIIVSSYTANLAAVLTMQRMKTDIQSYEDLAKQTDIKYGIVNSGSTREFFQKSDVQIFRRMWQFMESNEDVFMSSVSAGVKKVQDSKKKGSVKYAFLLESTTNDYYNQREPCTTTKVGPNFDTGKGYGIATPPSSDLRDKINLAVLQLKDNDTISKLYVKWWKDKSECNTQEDGSNQMGTNSVDFDKVQGLYYLLGCGILIGFFLSFLELFYRCAVDAKRQKRSFGEVFKDFIKLNRCSSSHTSKGKLQTCNDESYEIELPQSESNNFPDQFSSVVMNDDRRKPYYIAQRKEHVGTNSYASSMETGEPQILLPAISSIQSPLGCNLKNRPIMYMVEPFRNEMEYSL